MTADRWWTAVTVAGLLAVALASVILFFEDVRWQFLVAAGAAVYSGFRIVRYGMPGSQRYDSGLRNRILFGASWLLLGIMWLWAGIARLVS